MRPPRRTAIEGAVGSPNEKSGTKPAVEVALFAAFRSGDPLDRPLSEPLGVLGDPLLEIVGHECRDRRGAAGEESQEEPDARGADASLRKHCFISAQVGIQLPISISLMAAIRCSTLIITSLIAKSPTITLMKSTPAFSVTVPKVSRAAPVSGSCPIRAAPSPGPWRSAP